MIDWLSNHYIDIILILVLATVGLYLLVKLGNRKVQKAILHKKKTHPQQETREYQRALNRLVLISSLLIISVVVTFLILAEVGIGYGILIAAFGGAAIVAGFATRKYIKDLVTGFFIAIDNYYYIGDVISIAGVTGIVDSVDLRRTTLRDQEGIYHVIYNREVNVAVNFSKVSPLGNVNILVTHNEEIDEVISDISRIWEEMAMDPVWGPLLISKIPWLYKQTNSQTSMVSIKVVGEIEPKKHYEITNELRQRIKNRYGLKVDDRSLQYNNGYFSSN